MGSSREARLWMRLVDHVRERGEPLSLRHACEVCADAVRVAGVGLSMLAGDDQRDLVCAVGDLSERLEELQVTVGEGPSIDVLESAGPVLVAGLSSDAGRRRWPVFAAAAVELGVQAVFAFPLQVGAIRLGVLTLYRGVPGSLDADELADALVIADLALVLMLDTAAGADANDADVDATALRVNKHPYQDGMELRQIEVHQAVGVIAAQLDVGVAEALVRLRAYAFSTDQRLSEVAHAVLARRIRLGSDHDGL